MSIGAQLAPRTGLQKERRAIGASTKLTLPLWVKAVLRSITNEPRMRERTVVRLSVIPSTKCVVEHVGDHDSAAGHPLAGAAKFRVAIRGVASTSQMR
jgi:hypothetical protein